MSLAAYLEELADVPALVLSHGLKRLVRKGGEFVPPVSAIRRECALVVREWHRRAAGLDALPPAEGMWDQERWLERAAEPVPLLGAGSAEVELPATAEQRARGAALLEAVAAKVGRKL